MTLDEVIKKAEGIAEEKFNTAVYIMDKMKSDIAMCNAEEYKRCAEEYRQLAEWLKELKQLREQEPVIDKIRAEIEQAADKQFQIAKGVADLNERYMHIQMENAYRHSLSIIDNYKAESEEQA